MGAKIIFDKISLSCSRIVTRKYSTSFSIAVSMLGASIRQDIYNIYGFTRLSDEIVDTFHQYPKKELLCHFKKETFNALKDKISLNPILNSFQMTINKYKIDKEIIIAFFRSMEWDLERKNYEKTSDYEEYIHGSANVVGLMCLKVFVKGNYELYKRLKAYATRLGTAFQKVNFLRDIKDDYENLNRVYFPNINYDLFDEKDKLKIIEDIEKDFGIALKGIKMLPKEGKFGVYIAYKYYNKLLIKIKKSSVSKIKSKRIRISNYQKANVLVYCYMRFQLNYL